MLKRLAVATLLAIQVFGSGAVTLAHARDVLDAPAAIEAHHDARCAILHDELRCALCHYAGARVIVPPTLLAPAVPVAGPQFPAPADEVAAALAVRTTTPARAPPALLS